MELRHLRYLVAAGETENFRSAAKRLHVSPPAITHLIHALERELEFALFERLPRGIRLTAAGRSFLADAQQLLLDLDRARERAKRVSRGQVGTLRISFNNSSAANPIMRRAIRAFHFSHPEVEIELVEVRSKEQLVALREYKVDAGFAHLRERSLPDLEFLEIHRDDVLLVVPVFHRLAKRRKIQLSDLRDESFVIIQQWIAENEILVEACRAKGFSPHLVRETYNYATLLNMVSVGMGLAVINAAQTEVWPEAVQFKKIVDLPAKLHLDLIWRRSDRSPIVTEFVQTVRATMKSASSKTRQANVDRAPSGRN